MGGGFTEEQSFDHKPYASLHQLFYESPKLTRSSKLSEKDTGSSESSFSRIARTIYDDSDISSLRNKQAKCSRRFLRPLSKSFFHSSHSELHFETKSIKSNIENMSWLSRSENFLNNNDSFKLKSKKECISWMGDDTDYKTYKSCECEEIRKINSCEKIPVDDVHSEEKQDTSNKYDSMITLSADIYPYMSLELKKKPENFWGSPLNAWRENLTLLKTKTKKKNEKRNERNKPLSKQDRKISNSYDFIRPMRTKTEQCCFDTLGEEIEEPVYLESGGTEYEIEDTFSTKLSRRRSVTVEKVKNPYYCDGVFGCT